LFDHLEVCFGMEKRRHKKSMKYSKTFTIILYACNCDAALHLTCMPLSLCPESLLRACTHFGVLSSHPGQQGVRNHKLPNQTGMDSRAISARIMNGHTEDLLINCMRPFEHARTRPTATRRVWQLQFRAWQTEHRYASLAPPYPKSYVSRLGQ
jgi:hypothetical protein